MEFDGISVKESPGLCRCCLSEGCFYKDLGSEYTWMDETEVYIEMLLECFDISISQQIAGPNGPNCLICEVCITRLRDACNFKKQVLESEKKFMDMFGRGDSNSKVILYQDNIKAEVALEPQPDEETEAEYLDEDIDYDVKEESPPPQPVTKKKTITRSSSKNNKQMKSLVNKELSFDTDKTQINKKDLKIVKNSKITVKNDLETNLSWTTRTSHDKRTSQDKIKHKENLLTILKYSNVTPFKSKSLLGFICGYCDATYPDPLDLRVHTEKDHEKERLEFKSSFEMTKYTVKVDVTDLCCLLCSKKMDNLSKLKDHLVKIHDKTIYDDIKDHIKEFKLKKGDVFDCAMCPSSYETFKMLNQHMNKHYSNYTCPKCDKSFAIKRSLYAHQKIHQEGSFKCDLCEKVFSNSTKKKHHEKAKHLGASSISNCPYCDVPFRSYYQRNQHLIKVHNCEAQYKCNVCNKGYALKCLLMDHIKKNHLMERDFKCTECGKRFFSKRALNSHMIKHTGERKYTCDTCHKSYTRRDILTEHMKKHNNDKQLICEVCSTTFVQKCRLRSHLMTRHGISMAASDIPIS
ncbi:unnamed protein product [Euphydryas editha]|uniref:Uncharacterized protein n=1 Tax=Euphydryas editha TaxID=104508 RepID=A0AAU9UR65_EUPED|nr:unnamed protein product [Euphydryas editha]